MKVDDVKIKKVLAMFDPCDIPYIRFDKILDKTPVDNTIDKPKVLIKGDLNDRIRKR